ANPFETIPNEQTPPVKPPATETPKPEAPKPAAQQENFQPPADDNIEAVEFRGTRRVPADTLRALVTTKKGDKLDEEQLHRDYMALYNTGRFDDLTIEQEAGRTGWIIRFVVVERRIVRAIKYDGMKSISVSEILDRFKERKVGLSVE